MGRGNFFTRRATWPDSTTFAKSAGNSLNFGDFVDAERLGREADGHGETGLHAHTEPPFELTKFFGYVRRGG